MTHFNQHIGEHHQSNSVSRREFLRKSAILAGGAWLLGGPLFTSRTDTANAMVPAHQGVGALNYALVLDGQVVGILPSVESGFISGVIATQQLSSGQPILKKHLATIQYEDIIIKCGSGMNPSMYQWIQATLTNEPLTRGGTILKLDQNFQVVEEMVFQDAWITEVGFPAFDTSSPQPAYITLKITPQHTFFQNGSGSQISSPQIGHGQQWLTSNFRLNIQGLENACAHVTRIEPLIWTRTLTGGGAGGFRNRSLPTPGAAETPNLVITLPDSQAGPFREWFYNFVIQGQASDSDEKPGMLEFLAHNLQQVLFTVSFGNLGIFRMSPVPQSTTSTASLVKVEMYCETMNFSQASSGGGSAQPRSAPAPQPRKSPAPTKRLIPLRKTR